MDKVIFKSPPKPKLALSLFKQCLEEVLSQKNIKGITLKIIIQEEIPEFSPNLIRINLDGDIVLPDYLYNAIEYGTLHIPAYQIISKTKKRMGRRPAWQIQL